MFVRTYYRFVTSDDSRVRASVWRVFVDLAKDFVLNLAESITEERGGVHVCHGRVDIREKDWVVLQ